MRRFLPAFDRSVRRHFRHPSRRGPRLWQDAEERADVVRLSCKVVSSRGWWRCGDARDGRGAFRVFESALGVALFAQIAAVQQLLIDLLQGGARPGGLPSPRHLGAVKIATICRIGVKVCERLNPHMYSPATPFMLLLASFGFGVAERPDAVEQARPVGQQ